MTNLRPRRINKMSGEINPKYIDWQDAKIKQLKSECSFMRLCLDDETDKTRIEALKNALKDLLELHEDELNRPAVRTARTALQKDNKYRDIDNNNEIDDG